MQPPLEQSRQRRLHHLVVGDGLGGQRPAALGRAGVRWVGVAHEQHAAVAAPQCDRRDDRQTRLGALGDHQ